MTPVKQYTTLRVRVTPYSLDKEVMQCTLHRFYTQLYPTSTTVLDKLKEDGVFKVVGGRFCLWRV